MDPLAVSIPRRPLRRWLFAAVLLLLLLLLAAPFVLWALVRGSLPPLEGSRTLAGLQASATVERDAAGVPTIHAANREDLMRALGYVHAQDRFFQMDLLRRQGAGELSELFGPAALPMDEEARKHRFRRQATQVIRHAAPDKLRLVQAYTAGVNAGLAGLRVRPWEYLLLRATPRPWQPEDTVLVADAMVMALEDRGALERTRLAVADVYGDEMLPFLRPLVTEATAALDGTSLPAPPVPDAAHFRPRTTSAAAGQGRESSADFADFRRLKRGRASELARLSWLGSEICGNLRNLRTNSDLSRKSTVAPDPTAALLAGWLGASPDPGGDTRPGSNNFALAGSRVAGGGALVANDPHLGLSVPAIWYRASLVLGEAACTGVTLPGIPALVLGSNGHVAWGFTNGQTDTSDVVIVERDPADPARYRVPDGNGWERFETVHETISMAHAKPVAWDQTWTRWGPVVVARDPAGRTLALHWSEYDPAAMNLELIDLMDARTVDEAVATAHRTGQHPQNFVAGDEAGHIAWTILGQVPRRVGFDGTFPVSWADGTRRWDGFLPPEEVPVIRDPAGGQLWTANNRVVGGEMLAALGNGGYSDPARAAQIRDRLSALAGRPAAPADGLAVQLDDEAIYMARWRDLLMRTLNDEAVAAQPALGELRGVLREWHGHAAVDEAGYRLVREFRRIVTEMVLEPIYAPVKAREAAADFGYNYEQPLWSIVSARPAHLLPSASPSWDALFVRAAAMTAKLGDHEPGGLALRDCTWGRANTLAMRHPFSATLPFLATRLDMPAQPLPGDGNMPRVQRPSFGASMRMVVIPGREKESIFEQPGGASGHFLSPFYRAGHDDWAAGRPSPFLPGAAKYRLVLRSGR